MKRYNEDPHLDATVLAALQDGLTPIAPAATLRQRILQRIQQSATANGVVTLRANSQTGWHALTPGIEFKMLTYHPEQANKSFLLRVQPGTRIPPHEHHGYEACLVIEGEFCIGDLTLRSGDFHGADASTPHVEAYTEHGVMVYLHVNIEDYPGVTL